MAEAAILDLLAPTPLAGIAPTAVVDVEKQLAYTQQQQQQSNWCWAATAVSVYAFYGRTLSQCELVGAFYGGKSGTKCCDTPCSSSCNQTLETAKAFRQLSILAGVDGPINFSRVKRQIDNNRPISCGVFWTLGGGGHAVVIDGYTEISSPVIEMVYVQDPASAGEGVCVLYTEFLTRYRGDGAWRKTRLTQAPT